MISYVTSELVLMELSESDRATLVLAEKMKSKDNKYAQNFDIWLGLYFNDNLLLLLASKKYILSIRIGLRLQKMWKSS